MSYQQLTLGERYVIAHLKMHKVSVREIGRRLNRSHTTISRELNRNGPQAAFSGPYWYDPAQARCDKRKAKARHHRRLHSPGLYQEYRKYKQGFQPIRGQVSSEKCNSTRWYTGSRGANPG